jgi:hypothetical protein
MNPVGDWSTPALGDLYLRASGGSGSCTVHFDLPIPADVLGSDVVIERITVFYDGSDDDCGIDDMFLVGWRMGSGTTETLATCDPESGGDGILDDLAVTSYTWTVNYTMEDSVTVGLQVLFEHDADKETDIYGFRLEYSH